MKEMLTVKIDSELKRELEEISTSKLERKSDIVRELLIEYVKKEKSTNEIKKVLAKKFAEGKLSFDDLVKHLGYDQAKKIAFYVDIAKESFMKGLD